MNLRYGYLVVGVFWALFIAPVAVYSILGWMAGVLWIYVFGDNPWPSVVEPTFLVIGIVIFFSVAASCIYLVFRHGRRREATVGTDTTKEWRRVFVLATTPLALIAITLFFQYQRSLDLAEARALSQQRETAFEDLLNARHRISELVVVQTDEGDWEVRVSSYGEKSRPYRLHWTVNAMVYGEVLSGEMRDVDLDVGGDALAFRVPRNELATRYLDEILIGNSSGVLVDEPFEIVVTLVPEFDSAAFEGWPEFERFRWENGESPFLSVRTEEFPVWFRVERDGTIRFSAP